MKKYLSNTGILLFLIVLLSFGCNQNQPISNKSWTQGPFVKADSVNPIMGPVDSITFMGPIQKTLVKWEAKDVFNPAAVVRNGKIYLLYRAQDSIGKPAGTSRIGLAVSNDGLIFKRYLKPVLYPENDKYKKYEWQGGTEDPRIVQNDSGTYYMTYTAYDGETARLFIATSNDLRNWVKHGSVFNEAGDEYVNMWSKSGAIVCRRVGDKFIATKINGKYWMYFGDTDIFLAHSEDLINWTPVEKSKGKIPDSIDNTYGKVSLLPALKPRKGKFDSQLVESGPFALITKKGILLIYNSKNSKEYGDTILPAGTYSAGQALFDINNPEKLIARTQSYFIKPDKPYEITGQVNNVIFVEGLAYFKSKWFLYYGTADTKIAVAVYTPRK